MWGLTARETYVALKLQIDNWRWPGVPFYLRPGKALSMKRTDVAIKFREAPFAMFKRRATGGELSRHRHRTNRRRYAPIQHQVPVPRSELAARK
jgi:hypothetical protein